MILILFAAALMVFLLVLSVLFVVFLIKDIEDEK